jgi:hypothetical protein
VAESAHAGSARLLQNGREMGLEPRPSAGASGGGCRLVSIDGLSGGALVRTAFHERKPGRPHGLL